MTIRPSIRNRSRPRHDERAPTLTSTPIDPTTARAARSSSQPAAYGNDLSSTTGLERSAPQSVSNSARRSCAATCTTARLCATDAAAPPGARRQATIEYLRHADARRSSRAPRPASRRGRDSAGRSTRTAPRSPRPSSSTDHCRPPRRPAASHVGIAGPGAGTSPVSASATLSGSSGSPSTTRSALRRLWHEVRRNDAHVTDDGRTETSRKPRRARRAAGVRRIAEHRSVRSDRGPEIRSSTSAASSCRGDPSAHVPQRSPIGVAQGDGRPCAR